MTKIALFLPNWLGDLVMATPTLRALRRRFGPEAKLVGIFRPHLADLLAGTNWLDQQWPFDPRSHDPNVRRWALVRRMRRERFDLALLLTNSLHTALLAWLGGARQRLGYVRYGRGSLLTQKLYPAYRDGRPAPSPMVDYYLQLARAAGCEPESPRLELALTEAERRLGETAWRELGLGERVIVFNSSGAYGAAKLWPADHFGELARRLVDDLDYDVLVICGPQERQLAREIALRAGRRRVVSLADQPVGLALSKACIQRSRLMVSTDSGPRHIAAAFGKPVITLFGPTLPIWIENPTVEAINLRLELGCIACGKRVCPLGHHRCLEQLSVDAVFVAVARLLKEQRSEAA